MRQNIILTLIVLMLLCSGCATLQKKSGRLEHGLSMDKVIALWGRPNDKIKVGLTADNYPVEVWEYRCKGIPAFKKEENCVLIFVDGELYQWAVNDPNFVFKALEQLGVLNPDEPGLGLMEYQRSLQKTAEDAVNTQRTLEMIRSFEQYKNTQMQIQTMQQIQIIRQQQLPIPPPPAQSPVRQQK